MSSRNPHTIPYKPLRKVCRNKKQKISHSADVEDCLWWLKKLCQ